MIQLGQAGSHLSASRSRRCDNDQRTGGFDVIILSIAFVAHDMRNIVRISVDGIQNVYRDIQFFQFFLEGICTFLTGVLGDRNASHIQTFSAECLDQSQHIHIIGDTEVPADLIFFNIAGADNNNDFCLIRKLH